jgi:hypothetical protein
LVSLSDLIASGPAVISFNVSVSRPPP